MSSTAIATVVKMMETLPEPAQNQVLNHLREYLEDVRDELRWDETFARTQAQLVAAARRAKQEIAAGQAKPMDSGWQPWRPRTILLVAVTRVLHDFHILPGERLDAGEVPRGQCFWLDQRPADAQGACPGAEEIGGCLEVDSACRHQPHLGQGTGEGLEIAGPDEVGGKDLHDVGPGLPCGDNLGRRECPGKDELAIAAAEPDHAAVHVRADNELGPGENRGPRGLGIEDRAGAEEDLVAEPIGDLFEHLMGPGNGESDFDGLDAAGQEGGGGLEEHLAARGPEDRHHPTAEDTFQIPVVRHGEQLT